MDMELTVGRRRIGSGHPCYVIAEVGLAHDGSLGQAHAYIDGCAHAGVEAVKFQCHLDDPTNEWRIRPDWCQDASRTDYWVRTGFSEAQWQDLARHCAAKGVEFLCSVFSVPSFRLIDPLVRMHKIPSGRIADLGLLRLIADTGKPALLSTGMATIAEIHTAGAVFEAVRCPYGVLQCTTIYPTPPELVGLEYVPHWGLSDHSGTIYPGIAAAALGCEVLEVHVCFTREAGGLDGPASLTMADLGRLVEGVRFVQKAMRPVDKEELAEQLEAVRQVFMA